MKVIFFGSSQFVIPIIEKLKANFNLLLVLTTEQNISDPVLSYCSKNNIPLISTHSIDKNAISEIKKLNPDIGALASFGLIISNEVLDIFPKGILNIHPSLLPKYRGPTPVQTAIKNNDKKTGISLIKLDSEVDHGDIYMQKEEDINPNDTSKSLYEKLFNKGADMLLDVIKNYDSISPVTQNHTKATFTDHLTRESGHIDINKLKNKEELQSLIKAYYPWPGVWTNLEINNKKVRIKFLPNNELQVEGKKVVSFKDFLNGYPNMKELIDKIS